MGVYTNAARELVAEKVISQKFSGVSGIQLAIEQTRNEGNLFNAILECDMVEAYTEAGLITERVQDENDMTHDPEEDEMSSDADRTPIPVKDEKSKTVFSNIIQSIVKAWTTFIGWLKSIPEKIMKVVHGIADKIDQKNLDAVKKYGGEDFHNYVLNYKGSEPVPKEVKPNQYEIDEIIRTATGKSGVIGTLNKLIVSTNVALDFDKDSNEFNDIKEAITSKEATKAIRMAFFDDTDRSTAVKLGNDGFKKVYEKAKGGFRNESEATAKAIKGLITNQSVALKEFNKTYSKENRKNNPELNRVKEIYTIQSSAATTAVNVMVKMFKDQISAYRLIFLKMSTLALRGATGAKVKDTGEKVANSKVGQGVSGAASKVKGGIHDADMKAGQAVSDMQYKKGEAGRKEKHDEALKGSRHENDKAAKNESAVMYEDNPAYTEAFDFMLEMANEDYINECFANI